MDFYRQIASLPSSTPVDAPTMDITFVVSNTKGKRFRYCRQDVLEMLKAIKHNIADFSQMGDRYIQKLWRHLVDSHFEGTVKTSAGNQTLLTFTLIAKFIWAANDRPHPYDETSINFTADRVEETIRQLTSDQWQDLLANVGGIVKGEPSAGPSQEGGSAVVSNDRVKGGQNILLSGSPGTGKTHLAEAMASAGGKSFYCSFSPDTQHNDFFGGVRAAANAERSSTVFGFTPGAFLKAYSHAWSNPSERVYLVIDEINRGNVGAVLGDVFTLLDRTSDGSGRYAVEAGNNGVVEWLTERTGDQADKLRIPSNLWIIATMNTGDQSVTNLDTAFLRRWSVRHVHIDYDKAPDVEVTVATGKAPLSINYRRLLPILNDHIVSELGLNEDRRVGQYFVSADCFGETGGLPEQLLFYLWTLSSRVTSRSMFIDRIKTKDDLFRTVRDGRQVFRAEMIDKMLTGQVDG